MRQLAADHRSVAMILAVPVLVITLMYFMFQNAPHRPGTPTPFFSFPDVNWGQVPGDVINSLIKGFQKEFFSGHPTPGTPNSCVSRTGS